MKHGSLFWKPPCNNGVVDYEMHSVMAPLHYLRSLEQKKRWIIAIIMSIAVAVFLAGGAIALQMSLRSSVFGIPQDDGASASGKILREELGESRRMLFPAIGGLKSVIQELTEEVKKQSGTNKGSR